MLKDYGSYVIYVYESQSLFKLNLSLIRFIAQSQCKDVIFFIMGHNIHNY